MKRIIATLLFIILFLFLRNNCANCQPPIMCFGDSFTWGNGTSAPQYYRYPEVLQTLLNYPVINLGVSGETSHEILTRVLQQTQDEKSRPQIFWVGRNDGYDTASTIRCLDSMIQFIGHNKYLVLQELNRLDWKYGSVEWQIYEDVNKRLRSKYGYHYLAIRDSMCVYKSGNNSYDSTALHDSCANQFLMWDFVHPRSEGYYLIAQKIAQRSAVLFGSLGIQINPLTRRQRTITGYFIYEIFSNNGQKVNSFSSSIIMDEQLKKQYPAGQYFIARNGSIIKY